jgi:hypothetical protein
MIILINHLTFVEREPSSIARRMPYIRVQLRREWCNPRLRQEQFSISRMREEVLNYDQ